MATFPWIQSLWRSSAQKFANEGPTATRRSALVRHLIDRIAGIVIQGGGLAVVMSILAICVFLVLEVVPLFRSPSATLMTQFQIPQIASPSRAVHVGIDDHREVGYVLSSAGLSFLDLRTGHPIPVDLPQGFAERQITTVARAGNNSPWFAVGTKDGWIIPMKITIATKFSEAGTRSKHPSVSQGHPFHVGPDAITSLAYRVSDQASGFAVATAQGRLVLLRSGEDQEAPSNPLLKDLPAPPSHITALALDAPLTNLYAGTDQGLLSHYDLADSRQPSPIASQGTREASEAVATLGFLNGDRTLVVTTASGTVSTWTLTRNPSGATPRQLKLTHRLASHQAAVTSFSPSQRDRSFLTGDAEGNVWLHYATLERTLLQLPRQQSPISSIAFAPKGDGALIYDDRGRLTLYELRNPHPEVSLRGLFGKVWYEGYDEPTYVWQSSSGSDEFEPKFSLIPLLFGTLKGTFYALLLAVPIAICAAVFTSQFMHPSTRATIKPAIEMLAALPTVVLGFIAALWLAPLLERWFPALIGMIIVIPIAVVFCAFLWRALPGSFRGRIRPGTEAFLLLPLLIVAIGLCLFANHLIEQLVFAGDFKTWISTQFGVQYDQRNAVVVGIVMGFAIIPIIYSISEEALSNVPRHLIAGSLALGATRWQTMSYLVLLAASPGIFSAIMIGFGRAVGETMIVLMATGNTPIMDWSWANGFRTLSANIAVEIPEAPQGGTLFRVLFLAALLLFIITFVINTAAELVRQRLREKYATH
jgi:phosphate transport system permease protein